MDRPRRQPSAPGVRPGSRLRRAPATAGGTPAVERILQLQRDAGNEAVSRALDHRRPPAGAAPAPAGLEPVLPVVARQAAAAPARVTVDVGWGKADTNGYLAAAGRVMIAELRSELDGVDRSKAPGRRAEEWIDEASASVRYLESKSTEPIEATVAQRANLLIREYGQIRLAIYEERIAPVREGWREARRQAERAADGADAMADRMDDALRAAFRSGSQHTIKDVVAAVKSCISIGRSLRTLAEGIGKEILKLDVPSGTKMSINIPYYTNQAIRVEIVSVSKYTDLLTKLGKALALVSTALTVADRSKRATDLDQGMKDLNDAFGIGSDIGTLIGAPPHMSLMNALYLKPMLQVITVQVGQLGRHLSDENRAWVELTGELGRPNVEPGGTAMFAFMRQVMHAGGAVDVPPIEGEVAKYFYDHRDKLEAGAEAAVPIRGWLFWKELDPATAAGWVFRHRQRIWAMLYGSMQVPPPR
jgi:hypothetical protein